MEDNIEEANPFPVVLNDNDVGNKFSMVLDLLVRPSQLLAAFAKQTKQR
jgi:hypothetical protein